MKIKTAELTDAALDWAVAKCEGYVEEGVYGEPVIIDGCLHLHYCDVVLSSDFRPTLNWGQGGPIIEREGISTLRADDEHVIGADGFCIPGQRLPVWCATTGQHGTQYSYESERYPAQYEICESDVTYGPTPLIAAMRCYCASKLGDEVDIPAELVQSNPI